MASDTEFYRTRADAEWANAEAATLDNVRDRCERSARAWAQMADRSQRVQDQRVEREAATIRARGETQSALAALVDSDDD